MVALVLLFSSLLLVSSILASPIPDDNRLRFPPVNPRSNDAQNIDTAFGTAFGTADPSGATRFVVKYANANRWAPSTLVSNWSLPSGTASPSALPLACPQPGVNPSAYTEDCLSMVIYVPPGLSTNNEVPVLMWIHGGSFVVGSATGPGLDGSKLAIATQSIVAVVQYRLGALGFMAPDGTTNLAVKDVINAMGFLSKVVPAFSGSSSRITLAGQSSGAGMIRAILAVPSAASLFKSAILQSDPMNYGFLAPSTQQKLQSSFNGLINCTSSDKSCWNSLSLDTILNAQGTLYNNAVNIDPSTGSFEPIRPVRDGSLITSPLDSTTPFPQVNKPVLISTVLNEAGLAIYSQFPSSLTSTMLSPVCDASLGPDRTNTLLASTQYPAFVAINGVVDARVQLQSIGTDYMWRCSSWTFARSWVKNGGHAYVGLYVVGASYPGNDAVPYCTQPGVVCHQDDIEIVFGTVPNPTSAQAALVTEMQQRYKSFLTTGNPNAKGFATWSPATTSDVHALQLGGSGEASVGACTPSFWGQAVPYDYQVFGI